MGEQQNRHFAYSRDLLYNTGRSDVSNCQLSRSNWTQPEIRPSGTTYAMPISSRFITVKCGDSATSVRWYVLHQCRVIIDTSCNCLLPCKIKRSFAVVARQHTRTWLDGRAHKRCKDLEDRLTVRCKQVYVRNALPRRYILRLVVDRSLTHVSPLFPLLTSACRKGGEMRTPNLSSCGLQFTDHTTTTFLYCI